MKTKYTEAAEVFKAFCDENRIRILEMLQTGEKCGCMLLAELNVSQPTLSHHMKILCDSGIVIGRKEGKWMHYSISQQNAEAAADLLTKLTTVTGGDTAPCGEQEQKGVSSPHGCR